MSSTRCEGESHRTQYFRREQLPESGSNEIYLMIVMKMSKEEK